VDAIVRGAVGGLAGTAAMSATMALDRALGWMTGEVPPRKIARRAEEAVGIAQHLPRPAFEASWIVQHFAYGAAAGVAYEWLRRRARIREPLPAGAAFGAALWAASYGGIMPAIGLYPPPWQDRRERQVMIFVHHLIYGTALAATCRSLRDAER
jgi:uncharacterized membrane protein YagU involved in acid resistance